MEFRPVRPEEMKELVTLLGLVFNGGDNWFMSIITKDPWRALGRTYVASTGERIIANVQIHCRPIRYGRATLRMGGIGHVATNPEFRRQGLASRLLKDQIAYMRDTDYHLSLLYTGINPYYETFGWRTIPFASRRLILEGWAPRGGGEGYTVHPVRVPEELPTLAPVYDACLDHWVGPLARNDEYWLANPSWTLDEFLGEDRHACQRAERDGRTVGYVRGRLMPGLADRAAVDELCWLPGEGACVAPLLERFLDNAGGAGKTFVDLSIGESHPAYALLGGEERLEPLPDRGAMFRVIDLTNLLSAAAPELERRLEAAGIARLAPLAIDAELGSATIRADGSVSVTAHDGPTDLALTHDAFLRLFLGRESAADLSAKGELDWTTGDRTEDLAALFPPRPYWYCRYDKF